MLILTRRVQEAIIINDDVTITVLSVNGNQVRLGIDAPRDVQVHREEIYHRIQNEGYKSPPEKKPEAETKPERKPVRVDDIPVYSQPAEVGERPIKQPVILKKKRRVISTDNE